MAPHSSHSPCSLRFRFDGWASENGCNDENSVEQIHVLWEPIKVKMENFGGFEVSWTIFRVICFRRELNGKSCVTLFDGSLIDGWRFAVKMSAFVQTMVL
jgi:hypothetical protein